METATNQNSNYNNHPFFNNQNQNQQVSAEMMEAQKELQKKQLEFFREFHQSGLDTLDVMKSIKISLKHTLKESKSSQNIAKWMFGVTFGLGVVIIGFSIYFAFLDKALLSIAFGSIGLIDIIAHLIAKPPLQIQDARSNYTQLTAGVLSWFNDFVDKGVLASNYQQFSQQIIFRQDLPFETILKIREENMEKAISVSNLQFENSIKMLKTIEEIAEPTNRKTVVTEKIEKEIVSEATKE